MKVLKKSKNFICAGQIGEKMTEVMLSNGWSDQNMMLNVCMATKVEYLKENLNNFVSGTNCGRSLSQRQLCGQSSGIPI